MAPDPRIEPARFDDPDLTALIALHVYAMRGQTPAGHAHAFDLSDLDTPDLDLWVLRDASRVVSMGALKQLGGGAGEIKSMRTHPDHLRRGHAARMLEHLIAAARAAGMRRLSLETGTGPAFDAALALYRGRGFVDGPPFGSYAASPHNQFLHLDLAQD